jgi:hypothetical protein
MIRSKKKFEQLSRRTILPDLLSDFPGLSGVTEITEKNLVRLTPRSQDHWRNSFVRDSAEDASDFQSRASTVDRSTIHSQMHRLSGYVRHDESLTPSPRGRGLRAERFWEAYLSDFLGRPVGTGTARNISFN